MSYTVCPSCGQKALIVASRCPRCGLAFEEQFFGRSLSTARARRPSIGLLIAGVMATLLLANALIQRLTVARPVTPTVAPPAAAQAPPAATPPKPQQEPAVAAAESIGTAPLLGVTSDAEAQVPDTVTSNAPSAMAEPAGTVATQRRYASTWMNVRADRRNTALVLRVLHPGELVQVDSLRQGWYRVVSDGQPPGYVDWRLLDDAPSAATP